VCRHGGRVTTSVSGKTAFLVIGQAASKSKFNAVRGVGVEKGARGSRACSSFAWRLSIIIATSHRDTPTPTNQALETRFKHAQVRENNAKLAAKAAEKMAKPPTKGKSTAAAPPAPCKIIDEDGLFAIIRATAHLAEQPAQQRQAPQQGAASSSPASPAGPREAAAAAALARAAAASGSGAPAPMRGAAFHGGSSGGGYGAAPASGGGYGSAGAGAGASGSGAAAAAAAAADPAANQLWVDKYKPQTAADLVGNTGLINTLRQWLNQWEAIHLRGAMPSECRALRAAWEGRVAGGTVAPCTIDNAPFSPSSTPLNPPTTRACWWQRWGQAQGPDQKGSAAVRPPGHRQDQRSAHHLKVSVRWNESFCGAGTGRQVSSALSFRQRSHFTTATTTPLYTGSWGGACLRSTHQTRATGRTPRTPWASTARCPTACARW